jgi:nucleoside-diphosphate kinase
MASSEILGFIAEWYDPQPQMMKQFLLKVFVDTNDIEIYDKKTNKPFLKRTKIPSNLKLSDFFPGGKIALHARQIRLIDYADPYTRNKLSSSTETASMLLAPDMYYQMGKILGELTGKARLKVSKVQSFCFRENEVEELMALLGLTPTESLMKFWSSGLSIGVELIGENCLETLREVAERLNNNNRSPVMWTADGIGEFCFDPMRNFASTATLSECTCCVIRQEPVKTGDFAVILDMILSSNRFEISAIQMFQLNKTSATEFLEVYDGVMPNFKDMVSDLCLGPILVLEIKQPQNRSNVVNDFRDFVGPWDVEMAAELKPGCIRAMFGKSRTENAVHCTDLADDGAQECSYFFDILSGS